MTAPPARRAILCPLEFEARALRKARLADPVRVCGPGEAAVENAVREVVQELAPAKLILAGLAGGLQPDIQSGQAHWITRVVAAKGDLIADSPAEQMVDGLSICTVQAPAETPEAKQAIHLASGADLVDMESQRFVEVCEELGVPWAILRGVSDQSSEPLPPGTIDLVDAKGRPRKVRTLAFLARNPWRIPGLMKLAGRSSRAMKQVAAELSLNSDQ
ncbi:MAG: hypothetical protein P8M22_06700 [Phycisphaerales bacterium]|nr:hypothetical protein [Phycisphaerales bacterium]